MTVISSQQEALNRLRASGGNIDVGIGDGMSAAAEETWRAGPTAAITRAVQSVFDTSEKVSAAEANQMYGLDGTEAAFDDTEEITFDSAKAKAEDFHNLKMTSLIQETVNDESPVMGRVTQFAASMATSMVDPTMIAINVGGAAAIGSGAKALINSKRAFNGIAKASPAAAKALLATYSDDVTRGFTQIVAREGLENFATSVAEEAIIQNVGVGEERLARKITLQESLQNVVAGTFMGTGFGIALSKEGRKAVARSWSRDMGDDAISFNQSNHIIQAEEAKLGIESSGIGAKLYDRDSFEPRPWYNESESPFNPSDLSLPTKVFISLDESRAAHSFSGRGSGTVFTGSKVHAYNKGASVIEVDTANLNIISHAHIVDAKGRHTNLGKQLATEVVDEIVSKADPAKLSKIIAMMDDADIDLKDLPNLNRNQLRKILNDKLNGKSLDDITNLADDIAKRHELDYDVAAKIEILAEQAGFNGYQFTGKNAKGEGAYKGVYILDKFTNKIKKTGEFQTPKADAGGDVKWKFAEEQIYKQHAQWLKNDAKSLYADVKEAAGMPKETPIEAEIGVIHKSHMKEALASSQEKMTVLEQVERELMDDMEAAGENIDIDKKATLDLIQKVKKGEDPAKLLADEQEKHVAYLTCLLNMG